MVELIITYQFTSIKVESRGLAASLATTFLIQKHIVRIKPRLDEAPDKMGSRIVLHIFCHRTTHSLKIAF